MLKRLEWLFHMAAFALQCNALVPLLSRSSVGTIGQLGEATPANTLATALVLSTTSVLMLRNGRVAFRYARGMWPILSLVLLAILSASWSDYPQVTIHRAGSLVTATLWAWYVVARYDLKHVISVIRQSFWLLALASLMVGAASPSLGRGWDGWIGVFATKNDLGALMATAMITFFYTLLADLFTKRPRFLLITSYLAGFLLSAGLLYLSQSRTAWVVGFAGSMLCILVKMTHRRAGVAVILWTAIVLLFAPAVVIATNQLGTIATMLGKDSSLTGRVDLWLLLPSYIAQRPWLGHGFAAFWVQDSLNVFQIWTAVGWEPPHAHDGWLDVMLELGVAGLALAALQVVLIIFGGIRVVVQGRDPDAQYLLVTTFATLMINLTESNLVRPGVNWVLLVIAATALAKIARQRQADTAAQFARPGRRPAPFVPSRLG
jgi:exopolysaccharide production protein ExoQ